MTRTGTYTCDACHGVFEFARSEEEALAEAEASFPGLKREDAAQVCDDCYQKLLANERESLRQGRGFVDGTEPEDAP